MGSFSIREYTAKMRSVDFDKCWPFDGDGKGGGKGRWLPPISLRKSRWWFDELQAARSAREKPEEVNAQVGLEKDKDEKVIPIPNNDSMVVAPPVDGKPSEVAAAVDGKLVGAPARGKQKAPKKRSIVELFAVAPPVETMEDDGKGRDREVGLRDLGAGVKGGGESLVAPRKRKVLDVKYDENKTEKVRKNIKERIKKKKKKAKKKQLKVEIRAAKKEKIGKSKMPSLADISHILQRKLHYKQFRKLYRKLNDIQKRSVTVKSLSRKRNFKLIQTSKLISRKQKEVMRVLPIRSILKNQKGSTSVKKGKTIGDAQDGNSIKLCHESVKHVSFSGKDDILGLNKRCSAMELPQLQNLCKIFSDVLAASSAMDNLSKGDKCPPPIEGAQVGNASDKNMGRSDVERTDGTLSEEKQLSGSYGHHIPGRLADPSKRKSPETKETPLSESVDINHAVQDCNELSCFSPHSTMSPTHAYSGDPKVLNPIHESGSSCNAGTQGKESSQMTSNAIRNLHGPIEKCIPRSNATSSLTLARNPILQHSTSCLEKDLEASKEEHPRSVDSTIDFCSHQPGFQPVHHHSPKALISSISSSVGSKEFGESRLMSDIMSASREESTDQDIIGLPLNLQGELMQLHSNTKFVYCDFHKKQNSVQNPVQVPNYAEPNYSIAKMKGKFPCASLYQKDPLNWSLEQYHPTSQVVTSRLGFTGLQGFERTEIQYHESKDFDQYTHCDANLMEVSCCGCREHDKTENYIDRADFHAEKQLDNRLQPAIQPMMRLMGKNIMVGRSNEEFLGFHDGKRWPGNELITQNCPSGMSLNRWPRGESVDAESVSSKENLFKELDVPSSFYRKPAAEFMSSPMHLGFQPQLSGSEMSSAIGSHGYIVDLFGHSIPQLLLKKASNSAVSCNSGTQHVNMRHQQPVVGPYPQNVSEHMLLDSTHCKHSQSVSFSMPFFHSAFPDQDCRSFSQTSVAHSPQTLPHWLLNATQRKKIQQSSCPYSAPLSAHQPSFLCGDKYFPFSSPYPTPVISFPSSNFSQSYSLPGPAPVIHQSAIPDLGANKSQPAVCSSYRSKKKNNSGTKFGFANIKGPDLTNKTRKRPAARDDTVMNTVKKVNLRLQEGSNVPEDSGGREQIHGHPKCNIRSSEINACGSNIIDVGLPALGSGKESMLAISGSGPSNFDPQERSGFVKLSAGAKHILKPSQNMDHDKSRPVHSTIPFSVGTISDREPVSQNKASKAYRF